MGRKFNGVCDNSRTILTGTRGTMTGGHTVLLTGPLLGNSGVLAIHCRLKGESHQTVTPRLNARSGG